MSTPNIVPRSTVKHYIDCLSEIAGQSLVYNVEKAFTCHLSKADDEDVWWQLRLTQSTISELAESFLDAQAVPPIPCIETLQIVSEVLDSIANVIHVSCYFTEGFNARRALLSAVVLGQASKAVTDTVEMALLRWKFLRTLLNKFPTKSALVTVFDRIYDEVEACGDAEFSVFIGLENLNPDRQFEAGLITAMTDANYSSMVSKELVP